MPIQIHDLDTEDKKLVENELGRFMRGIEFIYKEPGVNRPLSPDDDAIRQIKYLISIPGFLSTKILELDPRWAPLRNQPEFKKMMESYSGK